ncbi:hypothetical protein Tco_1260521 [Tanacetum coccineum]
MVQWSPYTSEEHLLEQGDNASGEDYEDIDWNTEDELDITPSSGPSSVTTVEPIVSNGEASSSGPSNYKVVEHFLGMGFSEELIERAIKDNEEANTEMWKSRLLTESLDEINSCNQQQQCADDDSFNLSSDYDESPLNDISESGCWSGSWFGSDAAFLTQHEKALLSLANIGDNIEEACHGQMWSGGFNRRINSFYLCCPNGKD